MRKLILVAICLFYFGNSSAKTIIDMVGRSVEIPDNIERILPYDVKMSLLLFPVASHEMVAKALLPGSKKAPFIADEYNRMPEVDLKNIEAVMMSNPQLILAGCYHSDNNYAKYEKLQKRINIPVVIVNLSIDALDETYAFFGQLLGDTLSCNRCARYLKDVYAKTKDAVCECGVNRSSVYYSIGSSGLMTDPVNSKHTEIFDYLKLNNVAKVAIPTGGHVKVNMEQVLIWNPDYIFTAGFKADNNAFEMMSVSPKWKTIAAVENSQVYKVPSLPFGWFDHPPSVNRIPGLIWLTHVFYHLPADEAEKQIVEFYKLFYHYELSSSEYLSLF